MITSSHFGGLHVFRVGLLLSLHGLITGGFLVFFEVTPQLTGSNCAPNWPQPRPTCIAGAWFIEIYKHKMFSSQSRNVKLVGFGTSTLREIVEHAHDFREETLRSRWTAAEIYEGRSKYTMATDVWALGMTILEIFTGLHPFATIKSEREVQSKVLVGAIPVRPVEFTGRDQLWGLLVCCWQRDPNKRPPAVAVYETLKNMVRE